MSSRAVRPFVILSCVSIISAAAGCKSRTADVASTKGIEDQSQSAPSNGTRVWWINEHRHFFYEATCQAGALSARPEYTAGRVFITSYSTTPCKDGATAGLVRGMPLLDFEGALRTELNADTSGLKSALSKTIQLQGQTAQAVDAATLQALKAELQGAIDEKLKDPSLSSDDRAALEADRKDIDSITATTPSTTVNSAPSVDDLTSYLLPLLQQLPVLKNTDLVEKALNNSTLDQDTTVQALTSQLQSTVSTFNDAFGRFVDKSLATMLVSGQDLTNAENSKGWWNCVGDCTTMGILQGESSPQQIGNTYRPNCELSGYDAAKACLRQKCDTQYQTFSAVTFQPTDAILKGDSCI